MGGRPVVIDLTGDDDRPPPPRNPPQPPPNYGQSMRGPSMVGLNFSRNIPPAPRHTFIPGTPAIYQPRAPLPPAIQSIIQQQSKKAAAPPQHPVPKNSGRETRNDKQAHTVRRVLPPQTISEQFPLQLNRQRRICQACHEFGVTCDGEGPPCSACVEPQIDCVYNNQSKAAQSKGPESSKLDAQSQPRESVKGTAQLLKFPSKEYEARHVPPSISGAPSNNVHTFGKNHLGPSPGLPHQAGVDHADEVDETFFDDDSDLEDDFPLAMDNLEAVTKLLETHEHRMRAHREYLLQPLLLRAKTEAAKAPGVELPKDSTNPFTKLIAASSRAVDTPHIGGRGSTLHIKSHKVGASKKWTVVNLQTVRAETSSTILPKYKSIGRLGASLLAPNSGVMKYLPYFPDIEQFPDTEKKRAEEIEEWYHMDEDKMRDQRTCLELAHLWKPWVEQFISDLGIQFRDVAYHILQSSSYDICQRCQTCLQKRLFTEAVTLSRLQEQDHRSSLRAGLAVKAFNDRAKFSIWHVLSETELIKQAVKLTGRFKKTTSTLCSICFVHNCLIHGAYAEAGDMASGAAVFNEGAQQGGSSILINDDEHDANERMMTSIPDKVQTDQHQCGLFCVDVETSIRSILGRRLDGTIDGVFNRSTPRVRSAYDNDRFCSSECFWHVERRNRFLKVSQTKTFEPNMDPEKRDLFRTLLRLYADNRRAPCMIAKDMPQLSCLNAFHLILAETQRPNHGSLAMQSQEQQPARKLSKVAQAPDTSNSAELDQRPPFIPCSHEGSCQTNDDCSCSQDRVHCESFCGCDATCKRRFQGCNCAGSNKVCFNDSRCECWIHNRECDPWLCGTCGAVEVLDPANKYNEAIRKGRCRNTNIQLELPARTIKAPSEVQGWGLFAGEDLQTHAFIGEYKGERVGNEESDRRGSIYHHLGQEYLFLSNRDQQIDGSGFGNKMRFINNSQRPEYINVLARNLFCNGVQRMMLYAKGPIKAGDELLYFYNYPIEVTKNFWERGEGPARAPGAVVDKPNISIPAGRLAKKASKGTDERPAPVRTNSKQSGEKREPPRMPDRLPNGRFIKGTMNKNGSGSGSGSGSVSSSVQDTKRKRPIDSEASSPAYIAAPKETMIAQDESDGSDFEEDIETGVEEESSEEPEPSESSADVDKAIGVTTRQRRIHPEDRRLGGSAQKQAWETRKTKARMSTNSLPN